MVSLQILNLQLQLVHYETFTRCNLCFDFWLYDSIVPDFFGGVMNKYTLYTYDLVCNIVTCINCGKELTDEVCPDCNDPELGTWSSYSVNDVYKGETVEAESFEGAEKLFELKTDVIELDQNVDNSYTAYYRYKTGKYAGSPACEIRLHNE